MAKKLTYEFVKKQFEREDYKLLSKKYVNAHTKLKYKCPEGHFHSITWANWYQGSRCHDCFNNKQKLSINFVRSFFEKEGYIFLTKDYINSNQKLEYICPKGHKHSISWSKWQSGRRCPYCVSLGKPTVEFVMFEFEKENYKLLTKVYVNCEQKLEYICPQGHKHSVSWSKWRRGQRCPECYYLSKFGSGNPAWKGGISCEPYCDVWLDKDFKESILERDNYQCQNPDCWQTSKRLTIHHIDYVKKHCDPWNLITLCNSCNSRANSDREWHKTFYRIVMEKKNKIKKFVAGL